jgi:hypothetical protein
MTRHPLWQCATVTLSNNSYERITHLGTNKYLTVFPFRVSEVLLMQISLEVSNGIKAS